MCKTINMDGFDRIQVLFTNSLGGTTWSQFASADGFGASKAHTMLTGRSIVVPGHASPGNPHPKPETIRANEFELSYTISYSNPTGQVTPPHAQAAAGAAPAAAGQITNVQGLGVQQQLSPAPPCRQL